MSDIPSTSSRRRSLWQKLDLILAHILAPLLLFACVFTSLSGELWAIDASFTCFYYQCDHVGLDVGELLMALFTLVIGVYGAVLTYGHAMDRRSAWWIPLLFFVIMMAVFMLGYHIERQSEIGPRIIR